LPKFVKTPCLQVFWRVAYHLAYHFPAGYRHEAAGL